MSSCNVVSIKLEIGKGPALLGLPGKCPFGSGIDMPHFGGFFGNGGFLRGSSRFTGADVLAAVVNPADDTSSLLARL